VLTILGVSPLISLISVSFLQLVLHFIRLLALFFLTGKNPKMGNPGLYTFSYLYLVGTVHYQSFQQLEQTFFVLVFAYLLLAFVYHVKHKKLDQEITFIQMVTEKGYIKINGIDSFAGRVIDLTQQMGSYLYSPQTKGWTDFKGFEEVETINKTMVVKRAGFTVDQFPWFKGVTRFGVSADYINKEVKVTGKKGAYYYMDNIGWIDEKAFLDDAQATDIKIGDKVMLLETASAYQDWGNNSK